MKKFILLLLSVAVLLTACGQQKSAAQPETPDADRLEIVVTIFPAYDFARAVAGELADVKMLLPPGTESHSYEPTPADILAVQTCDLFIYLGGESDTWVETILSAVELQGETLRMVDCVPLLEEEHVEGMQEAPGHDHEHGEECHDHDHAHEEEEAHDAHESVGLGQVIGMDEHVWTAPANAAEITRKIGEHLAELEPENSADYLRNAAAYAGEIEQLDAAFEDFFDGLPNRTIVFGDRFPLRYFAEAYDLDYYAAFPGCGTQTEPSAATIAFLVEKVRQEEIPTVWYIEFSNHLVADGVAEAAGVGTAMFHTCHNVSRAEIDAGATYCSLMEENLRTLQSYMSK